MTILLSAAAGFLAVATAAHASSLALAAGRCRPRKSSLPKITPPVSLVRTVCGMENFSKETLESSFGLDWPELEILFCVAAANDPALPLLRRIIAQHPAARARILIGDDVISANPKLNNMVKGWREASHEMILFVDSNVRIPRDGIGRLLAAWTAGTGLVCSPPLGARPEGLWAEVECGFLNTYQARWQYAAHAVSRAFAHGKVMLWRRRDLESAGGMRALAREIAEDAASTKILRKAGLQIRLVEPPFPQLLGGRTGREVWRRQVRWARLRRMTFPPFFAPEILAGALPPLTALLVVAPALDLPVAPAAALFLALWYGLEAMMAYHAQWPLGWRSPLAWLARDLALPVLWLAALVSDEFSWRGKTISPDDHPATSRDREAGALEERIDAA